MKKGVFLILFLLVQYYGICQSGLFELVDSIRFSSPQPARLACNNGYLWVYDDSLRQIFNVDDDGSILDSIELDLTIKGFFVNTDTLWIITNINDSTSKIFTISFLS